ncbi:MAG: PTS system mannose/fructose/sorbose family transporter subunit IID [Gemmatimonadota bacterium]
MTDTASATSGLRLPLSTRMAMFVRLLAVQGAWNYETLVGNGIGFAVEPALRLLPGGRGGGLYRAALARQSQYFNAHPYLASVAVGALARAELEMVDPARIERFRTALCGPLGSCGDRLVWAAWLPFSALVALAAYGLGSGPLVTVAVFLILYNTGHIALRVWGLETGFRRGLAVAPALGSQIFRDGPRAVSRAGALVAGFAVPLAVARVAGPDPGQLWSALLLVGVGGLLVTGLRGRYDLWKWSLGLLVVLTLTSVLLT